MIITKITGGLGNQMFQYAIARAIAIKKNDIVRLDITAYETYKLHNGYRLNIFNLKENIATEKEIIKFIGKRNIFNKVLNKFDLNKNIFKEKERTIFDKEVFLQEDIYLDGYWQTEKYFSDIRTDILKDFTVKEKNTEIVDNYLKQINNSNSVSIHVRRGDYLNHPDIGVLDISYYKNAIEYIYNKVENPTFYIFSNDISWCEKNLDFIDDKIIINNTKSEIEDISLMKNCKYNIIANSSFSWWSAWLNINPSKIIIAPKIWMVKNPNNCKWVPDSWIEL